MTKAKHGELHGQLSWLFVTLIHGWDQTRGLEAPHLIAAPPWALPARRRSSCAGEAGGKAGVSNLANAALHARRRRRRPAAELITKCGSSFVTGVK